jgi:hypothetical protein
LITLFQEHGAEINEYIGCKEGRNLYSGMFVPFGKVPETPLAVAARCGHLSTVRLLLAYDADIEMGSRHGHTPLMFAAELGHLPVVKALAHAGAGIRARDCHDYTPIYSAALGGHRKIVRFLMKKGANFGPHVLSGCYERSPLTPAVESGRVDIVQYLLDHSAKIHMGVFLTAGSANKLEILEILARHSQFPEAAKDDDEQSIFAVAAAACGIDARSSSIPAFPKESNSRSYEAHFRSVSISAFRFRFF